MVGGALIGLLDLHSVGGDLGRLICPQPRPAYIQKGSSISWPAGWAPRPTKGYLENIQLV